MKGMSVVLILAICVGNIFSHVPVSATAANKITMTDVYNDGDWLTVEEGDTVTIESLEEWNMFARYAEKDIHYMQGITVELLDDIRVTPYAFSYDEKTMRIGISWYDSLEAAYDVNREKYYEDFDSEQVINYKWHGNMLNSVKHFNGIFEGNGHYIIGAYKLYKFALGGLVFSEIENAQVRNLNLSHFFLMVTKSGALCDTFSGEMINCHGSDLFLCGYGGLIGEIPDQCKASVVDCSTEVHMFPYSSSGGIIGAVGSDSEVMVEGNHTSGLIYGRESRDIQGYAGGIVGMLSGYRANVEIRNCVSEVNITGVFSEAGGIAGRGAQYLFECENRGNISISWDQARAGGVLGGTWGDMEITVIDQCRNIGKISSSCIAGGIVGYSVKTEIKNTENVGDVCCEGEEDVTQTEWVGIGGIVGWVENDPDDPNFVIKNSFCSGKVMGGKISSGGLIGVIRTKSSLDIDNVCFYGEVEAEKETGIILGKGKVPVVESSFVEKIKNVYYREQKISLAAGDGTEIPACMYPVSEAQMLGTEEDACIGEGDFAQTPNLCDALNSWCLAQDESEGMIGWKQGKLFPVLEIEDEAKPEKPEMVLPTFKPTPMPTEAPTASPTQSPTETPTLVPTAAPTQSSTEVPTSEPTASPTQSPTETPTLVPTASPTQSSTEVPTSEPTASPTQSPTETSTLVPTAAPPSASPAVSTQYSAVPAVTSVLAKAERNASVRVRWNSLAKVSGYTVYRSKKKTAGYRVIANVSGAKTEWRDKSAKEKCTYYYRVAAYRVVQGKKVYGACQCRPAKITVKLRAPALTAKKKMSGQGQHYIQIKIKKYRASGVELWGKMGKGSFRRITLKGVKTNKKTNVINLSYESNKQTFYIRARIYQVGKKKRYISYYSKVKRIRLQ